MVLIAEAAAVWLLVSLPLASWFGRAVARNRMNFTYRL